MEFKYIDIKGLNIPVCVKTDYVNITKICNEHGKQFFHWKKCLTAKRLLKKNPDSLFIINDKILKGMDKKTMMKLSGTYCNDVILKSVL